ncbi:expressed unknown protein [Seminavis robusta]|uniref:L domain-like protein n=1 Tax=Seminavis robusta TaxID=568900 RepID=A0A9N8HSQ0_9STRA|nr:expressed unknown protein [Seminavis robusta]|eukprot:Sro1756_g295630.1 n/a (525) ;mRNA; f:12981-14555
MSHPPKDNDDDSLQEALKRIAESEAVHPEIEEVVRQQMSAASLTGGAAITAPVVAAAGSGSGGGDDDSLEFCLKEIAAAEARGSITNGGVPLEVPMAPGDFEEEEEVVEDDLEEPEMAQKKPAAAAKPEMAKRPGPDDDDDEDVEDPMAAYRRREAEKLKAEKSQYKNLESADSFLTRPARNVQLGKGGAVNTGTMTPGAVSVGQLAPNAQVSVPQLAVEVSQMEQADPTGMTDEQKKKQKQQTMMESLMVPAAIGVTVVVVIIIIVVIVVTTAGGGEDETTIPMTTSTGEPEDEGTKAPLEEFAQDAFPQSTIDQIHMGATPQAQAYDWMVEDPALASYTHSRIRQRFALATFYFATGEWRDHTGWTNTTLHECDWFSKKATGACDDMDQMIHLALSDNDLEGTIPPELFWLTSLKTVDLFGNRIDGTIPSEFGLLTDLTSIDLSGNSLDGVIPGSLSELQNLTELYLESNQLTGHIPASLGSMSLEYLRLKGNNFRGMIPDEVCSIQSFTVDCTAEIVGCEC